MEKKKIIVQLLLEKHLRFRQLQDFTMTSLQMMFLHLLALFNYFFFFFFLKEGGFRRKGGGGGGARDLSCTCTQKQTGTLPRAEPLCLSLQRNLPRFASSSSSSKYVHCCSRESRAHGDSKGTALRSRLVAHGGLRFYCKASSYIPLKGLGLRLSSPPAPSSPCRPTSGFTEQNSCKALTGRVGLCEFDGSRK